MTNTQSLRHQLAIAIAELPQEALTELVSFVAYLRYKAADATTNQQPLSLAAMSDENSVNAQSASLHQRLLPEERAQAFLEWAGSHRDLALPMLADEAISRASIYGERS